MIGVIGRCYCLLAVDSSGTCTTLRRDLTATVESQCAPIRAENVVSSFNQPLTTVASTFASTKKDNSPLLQAGVGGEA